jgi:hypothetical protein
MRCEGCEGKFGSNGEPEIEEESTDVANASVSVGATVRIPCGNCGSDYKTAFIELEGEVSTDAHDDDCVMIDPETNKEVTRESDEERFALLAEDRTFDATDTDLQVSDDYRPKMKRTTNKKTGKVTEKPVPFRYQRHWYDVVATVSLTCSACGQGIETVLEDSISASEFEPV